MASVQEPQRGSEQLQARALGDVNRYRIFRYVARADRPVGVAELTAYLGVNHNAVRQHLARLREADLVLEGLEERQRPGRPRLLYRISPDAAGRWIAPGPYQRLAHLLAEALESGAPPREVGRAAGRRMAHAEQITDAVEAIDAIEEETARQGFRPKRRVRGDVVELTLDQCPLADVAISHPHIVCELHRGLQAGVAEASGAVVQGLVIRDPSDAGCRLRLKVTARLPSPNGTPA